MEVLRSSETQVITYKTTQHHNPEDPNPNFHHCKNPKSYKYTLTPVIPKLFTDTVIIPRLEVDALCNGFKFLKYIDKISNSYPNTFSLVSHSLQKTVKNTIINLI
jgi:hypothetical protein